MTRSLTFVDWEFRPAVTDGVRAFAVLWPGEGWTEVNSAELDSGRSFGASEAEFRAKFPDLPALPNMARQSSDKLAAAAE